MTFPANDLESLSGGEVAVSISTTCYFNSNMFDRAAAMAEVLDDYLARVGSELKWYSDTTTGRWKRANPELLAVPANRLRNQIKPEAKFIWNAHGANRANEASALLMQGKASGTTGDLSFVRLTFPLRTWADDWSGFVQLLVSWLERLPVTFGHAGYAFNESVERWQSHRDMVASFAPRFIGLELDDCYGTSMRVLDGIKGTNWLTMLATEFVDKLGGAAALRRQLSEAISIHPIANGIMIQAGPAPGVGDVNAGETLPLYREVARALLPVRVFDQPELLKFGRAGTQAWLRRFDD